MSSFDLMSSTMEDSKFLETISAFLAVSASTGWYVLTSAGLLPVPLLGAVTDASAAADGSLLGGARPFADNGCDRSIVVVVVFIFLETAIDAAVEGIFTEGEVKDVAEGVVRKSTSSLLNGYIGS